MVGWLGSKHQLTKSPPTFPLLSNRPPPPSLFDQLVVSELEAGSKIVSFVVSGRQASVSAAERPWHRQLPPRADRYLIYVVLIWICSYFGITSFFLLFFCFVFLVVLFLFLVIRSETVFKTQELTYLQWNRHFLCCTTQSVYPPPHPPHPPFSFMWASQYP